MNSDWLDRAKEKLKDQPIEPSDIIMDRLIASEIINELGEVTGHLHHWQSFLTIVGVRFAATPDKRSPFFVA